MKYNMSRKKMKFIFFVMFLLMCVNQIKSSRHMNILVAPCDFFHDVSSSTL